MTMGPFTHRLSVMRRGPGNESAQIIWRTSLGSLGKPCSVVATATTAIDEVFWGSSCDCDEAGDAIDEAGDSGAGVMDSVGEVGESLRCWESELPDILIHRYDYLILDSTAVSSIAKVCKSAIPVRVSSKYKEVVAKNGSGRSCR